MHYHVGVSSSGHSLCGLIVKIVLLQLLLRTLLLPSLMSRFVADIVASHYTCLTPVVQFVTAGCFPSCKEKLIHLCEKLKFFCEESRKCRICTRTCTILQVVAICAL